MRLKIGFRGYEKEENTNMQVTEPVASTPVKSVYRYVFRVTAVHLRITTTDMITRVVTNPILAVHPNPIVRCIHIKAKRPRLRYSPPQRSPRTNPIPRKPNQANLKTNTVLRIMLTPMISITTTTMISTIMRMRRIIITSTMNKWVIV